MHIIVQMRGFNAYCSIDRGGLMHIIVGIEEI
jgi:hypothetical protein